MLTMSPISDTVASFLADGVFLRFPNLRLATIENGADWVGPLFKKLSKVYKMRKPFWDEDPRETFRRHVWVAPFYEDDLEELARLVGVDHMLFGSDWPHAEGLADPLEYVDDLDEAGFDQDAADKIMYANAKALAQPLV
jgi:predicted TIM-barrel fold metal-dependent hydrolase